MATTNIPNSAGKVGVARSDQEVFVPPLVVQTGSFPIETEIETLVDQGAELPPYSLVGRITASDKVTFCNPSASDGSETPIGITAATAADVSADQKVSVIKTGVFNPNVINFDDSTTGFADIAEVKAALRASNPCLFLRAPKTATPA